MASFSSPDHSDQVISGAVAPEDLPAGAARVASMLAALRSPMTPGGAREQEAEAAFVAAVRGAPPRIDLVPKRPVLTRVLSAKAMAATAAVLVLGTGAAAATGSLPDAAQSAVARALEHVDVSVPNPEAGDHAGGVAADHRADAVGPDAAAAAQRGLCTAWEARHQGEDARGASDEAVAFSNLRHQARDEGMAVAEFCADVLSGHPAGGGSGDDHGRVGPDQGRDPAPAADDRGRSGDHPTPPVDTPNAGGIDTGTHASDGANAPGADAAPAGAGDGGAHADDRGPNTPAPDTPAPERPRP